MYNLECSSTETYVYPAIYFSDDQVMLLHRTSSTSKLCRHGCRKLISSPEKGSALHLREWRLSSIVETTNVSSRPVSWCGSSIQDNDVDYVQSFNKTGKDRMS
ncbi:hypothetical protein TNCV_34781 [Trichonephila clavipes]|nr:hypothetical protein TNCV_34781 [Trichonephila clavipes]